QLPVRSSRRRTTVLRAAMQARARELAERLPPETLAELRSSLLRLRRARSPRQAVAALELEIEHLFRVVAPTLAEHPLSALTPARAAMIVGAATAAAASVEELDAIALLIPGVNTAAVPGLAVVAAAAFAALVLEAYIAGSLRVHQVRAAGQEVDPREI